MSASDRPASDAARPSGPARPAGDGRQPGGDSLPDDRANISRVDSGSTHGWLVRFQREGEKYSRFFSDGAHGGRDAGFETARRWRDERRAEIGPTPTSDARHMLTPQARRKNRRAVSRTGVTGIGFVVREFASQRVPYVTAYWLDADGRRHQTSFSIQKHGVDNAVKLAGRARAATAEWHGEKPLGARALYNRAVDRVRELAAPFLPPEDRPSAD